MRKKVKRDKQRKPENKAEQSKKYSDLFENPMAKAAFNALTDKEKEEYKAWGENLFGHIDFEDSRVLKSMPPPVSDAVAYIASALKSGLDPEDLEDDEKRLMRDVFGDEWKLKYSAKNQSTNILEKS